MYVCIYDSLMLSDMTVICNSINFTTILMKLELSMKRKGIEPLRACMSVMLSQQNSRDILTPCTRRQPTATV